jgi:hypothetical protein
MKLKSLTLHFINGLPDTVFFDFEDFLKVVKPEDIKVKIKLYKEVVLNE